MDDELESKILPGIGDDDFVQSIRDNLDQGCKTDVDFDPGAGWCTAKFYSADGMGWSSQSVGI